MLAPPSSRSTHARLKRVCGTRINPAALLIVLGTAFLASAIQVTPAFAQTANDRPNIIVLFADDMGYGDLSSYGHPTIQTPQLDRMADEGLRLTSFYVAASVCTPSRAGLLTGRYPIRHLPNNLGPESTNSLPLDETLVGEPLQEAGYRTAMIGKWHLGHAQDEMMPSSRGFDEYYGLLYSNDMIRPWVQTDVPLHLHRNLEPIEQALNQDTLTVTYTKEAVRFIRDAQSEPFFLYLAYGMPHVPIYAAPHRAGMSRAGKYGDVVETIDWSVGEILKTLDEEGLDDNTLVLFMSDNGPWQEMPDRMFSTEMMPNHEPVKPWDNGSAGHLRGYKTTTFEGGYRVPFIARWPRHIPAGRTSAELVTALDLFPTLLRAAGVGVPGGLALDGHDVLPFFLGETASSPRTQFFYYAGDQIEAVRDGHWKLRLAGGDGPPQLFQLDEDPEETYNRADLHPDVVERLRAAMASFDASIR